MTKLTQGLLVCPTDAQVLPHALTLTFDDYEDAVQHAAATRAGLEAVITRDPADYRSATLPVYTPPDYLHHFFSSSRRQDT